MTAINLELDDLSSETRKMIREDIEEKIEELDEVDEDDFEAAKYDILVRKLENYEGQGS